MDFFEAFSGNKGNSAVRAPEVSVNFALYARNSMFLVIEILADGLKTILEMHALALIVSFYFLFHFYQNC